VKRIFIISYTSFPFYFSGINAQAPVINIDFKKELGEMKPIWA
jgi:hypothetical protein